MNFKKFVDLQDFDDTYQESRHKQKQKIKSLKEGVKEDKHKHRNRVVARNFKHGDFK